MSKLQYIYWQENPFWLGYLKEFPDYMTQGESLEDLKENLKAIYKDLMSGEIPEVRRMAELELV